MFKIGLPGKNSSTYFLTICKAKQIVRRKVVNLNRREVVNLTGASSPNATNVWDEGTDNILTGVNNIQGNNLGPQVQEAHDALKEMILLFKKH